MKRDIGLLIFWLIALLALTLVALSSGDVSLPLGRILSFRLNPDEQQILLALRVPRVIAAILIGASLAVSGLVYQMVFRNPLADPYILGVSSGAGVGVLVHQLILKITKIYLLPPLLAFMGSILAIFLLYTLTYEKGRFSPARLLLTGILIGTFFWSLLILLSRILEERLLISVFNFLSGSLANSNMRDLTSVSPYIIVVIGVIWFLWRELRVMFLPDEKVYSLGIAPDRFKKLFLLLASLLASLAVALGGVIGFVGLIVPHLLRINLGSTNRLLIPLASLSGAFFLLLADTIVRVLMPVSVPVSVITALAGAPLFILLFVRARYA